MPNNDHERIYVGGLDPSRGLTVKLVASRLCAMKGVEIISINDVPTNNKQMDNESNTYRKPIYKVKTPIIDEDGDLVDNRKFFYLEARAATTAETGESSSPGASALELLAKQYNGVKWKGCNLRVEAARPHFLKRLEVERENRDRDRQNIIPQSSSMTTAEDIKEEKEAIKNRRRLRVRKRFGEEAFHVDTLPHTLDICQDTSHDDMEGWNQFAILHKRMQDKRHSQYKKMAEKRKKDRRMWANKEETGKKDPAFTSTTNAENDDDLRSLIFLNRGIHVRFSDRNFVGRRDIKTCLAPDDRVSAASSSVASSNSDDSEQNMKTIGGRDAYVWSDDDDDDDDDDIDEDSPARAGEPLKQERQYAWSDEEDDTDASDRNFQRTGKDMAQQNKTASIIVNQSGRQKITNGPNYMTAFAIDEFSGGIDFDLGSNDFERDAAANREVDDNDLWNEIEDASRFCLDDDIRSNMNVLALLFPSEHFDKRPLAPPIASDGDIGNDDIRDENGVNHPSSSFGAGLIIHRYDPTKEADQMFELPRSSKDFINSVANSPPKVMDKGKDDENHDNLLMSRESSGDENLMQQATKLEKQDITPTDISLAVAGDKKTTLITNDVGKIVPIKDFFGDELEDRYKKVRGGMSESFSLGKLDKVNKNPSPKPDDINEREIYEQDKLEDVFKQSRGDDAGAGGFTFGFLNQQPCENIVHGSEKKYPSPTPDDIDESEIYEQDKLEDVFKQARDDDAGTGGFTFGFLNQESSDNIVNGDGSSVPSSFGIDHGRVKTLGGGIIDVDTKADAIRTTAVAVVEETAMMISNEIETEGRPRNKQSRGRKSFSKSDLDEFEKLFFSLNEGPQILENLEGMRHNDENQERWQKERQVLTDDWKRKQKSALSKKGKKIKQR